MSLKKKRLLATAYAILAAVFYAVNMPFSKLLLGEIEPTMMASMLYMGAGIGVGVLFAVKRKSVKPDELLSKEDFKYTLGMIVLDILAPVLLMFGLRSTTSANASLLNNFEIVATTLIALFVFGEKVSWKLWIAVVLVFASSFILSFEDVSSLRLSWGSLLVLLAALCWGLENNCTRKISGKNTYQIVMLKGVFSGLGALLIAVLTGETHPKLFPMALALLLGFVAYGLSITFYIKAQNVLGAAKTSAYYAVAPFVGVFLSFVFLNETLSENYYVALLLMLLGSVVIVVDTMQTQHTHSHSHIIYHTHDGKSHAHAITHSHEHTHMVAESVHGHHHAKIIVEH